MEELKHGEVKIAYPDVIEEMKKKYNDIVGVKVEIKQEIDAIKLSFGENDLYMTPNQAVDLMRELRRAVVKLDPKALRTKVRR